MGHCREDILYGLCQALVRNYLNNVGRGKQIKPVVVFQGGVASNVGIRRAFEEALGMEIIVPPYHDCMGALGAAILAKEEMSRRRRQDNGAKSAFRGLDSAQLEYTASSFECTYCANHCEVIEISCGGQLVARWGNKCPRWDFVAQQEVAAAQG
jgi:predicted NodU family carbamoyl transferase